MAVARRSVSPEEVARYESEAMRLMSMKGFSDFKFPGGEQPNVSNLDPKNKAELDDDDDLYG